MSCHHFGEIIPHVLVSNGRRLKQRVLYEIAETDTEEAEDRMLQTCTRVINRYERYLKLKGRDELVDRVELLVLAYELEVEYQYEKFRLIEAYYQIYHNTK